VTIWIAPAVVIVHLLTGSPVPLGVQWLAAVALFGGAVAVVSLRRRVWRVAAAVVALCGLAGTATSCFAAAVQPGAPPYMLRVAAPKTGSTVSSPVLLTVCGVRRDGSTRPATDATHYLVVFIDGQEVPTVDAWRFAETLTPGRHTIQVDLVTPSHHAFAPPAVATTTVTVAPDVRAVGPASC
jgi:hypothetical protein